MVSVAAGSVAASSLSSSGISPMVLPIAISFSASLVKNNNNSVTFGYSKSQISNFSQEDYDRANKQGLTQEADYILEQMVQNAENQQNS